MSRTTVGSHRRAVAPTLALLLLALPALSRASTGTRSAVAEPAAIDVMALSPEVERFIDARVRADQPRNMRVMGLLDALFGKNGLDIVYDLDYSETPSIGRQVVAFRLDQEDFAKEIAPARTFSLQAEAAAMQAKGIGAHLTTQDVLVVGPDGPIDNEYRFPDECARHKICDLVGDLALLGRRLRGRIVAHRTGHE